MRRDGVACTADSGRSVDRRSGDPVYASYRPKDVTVRVTSTDPRLTVRPGVLRLPAIPAGGIAALPHFALTATRIPSGKAAGEGQSDNVGLQLEIRAAGDYRQSLWLGVTIVSPQK
jgi:hypothetical protein